MAVKFSGGTGLRVVWVYVENFRSNLILLLDIVSQFSGVFGVPAKGVQWVR